MLFLGFSGCAVGRATGKTTWFIVSTSGKMTMKSVKFGTKTGYYTASTASKGAVKASVKMMDLTANATMRLVAQRESVALAQQFWLRAQGGQIAEAYLLLSPYLRSQISPQDFAGSQSAWTHKIQDVAVGEPVVHPQFVEVPVQLAVRSGKKIALVPIRMLEILDNTGNWLVDGWMAE